MEIHWIASRTHVASAVGSWQPCLFRVASQSTTPDFLSQGGLFQNWQPSFSLCRADRDTAEVDVPKEGGKQTLREMRKSKTETSPTIPKIGFSEIF